MSEPHGRAALDLVQATAEAWRGLQAQERVAREAHVDAMRAALHDHPAQDVARAAGCSFQAMYQALERRDGKRRTPKAIKPVPIDA